MSNIVFVVNQHLPHEPQTNLKNGKKIHFRAILIILATEGTTSSERLVRKKKQESSENNYTENRIRMHVSAFIN